MRRGGQVERRGDRIADRPRIFIDLDAVGEYLNGMIDWPDAVIRLTAAAVVGGVIGLDRELRGKPTGVRTMGIVALGSASSKA